LLLKIIEHISSEDIHKANQQLIECLK